MPLEPVVQYFTCSMVVVVTLWLVSSDIEITIRGNNEEHLQIATLSKSALDLLGLSIQIDELIMTQFASENAAR